MITKGFLTHFSLACRREDELSGLLVLQLLLLQVIVLLVVITSIFALLNKHLITQGGEVRGGILKSRHIRLLEDHRQIVHWSLIPLILPLLLTLLFTLLFLVLLVEAALLLLEPQLLLLHHGGLLSLLQEENVKK